MTSRVPFSRLHQSATLLANCEVLGWEGRLDNRDELRRRLGDAVSVDATVPALVCAAYERWGVDGLAGVIGDWSVVILDRRRHAVVLASDFAGVRPLYYHRDADSLLWSTRLEPLRAQTGISTLDEHYVAGFLLSGGYPDRTPYAEIYSVPPGRAVVVTDGSTTVQSFWSLSARESLAYADERDYDDQFRSLFREAVAVRLQRPLPVVAELSGGLDSSSVVCMANELIRSGAVAAPQLTTISYVHRESLDTPFISDVEAFCGIEGVHLSTHTFPLVADDELTGVTPERGSALVRAAATTARRLGASTFLTGQNGDLVTGNWFDDSLQVAASLRSWRPAQACRDALAWSKVLRLPIAWILWRAFRAAAIPPLFQSDRLYAGEGGSAATHHDSSLTREFLKRTGVIASTRRIDSDEWKGAPPDRRAHFRALSQMRLLRRLQPPEPLQDFDYTHPFAHRPLVEFLMRVPAGVLCQPGEPRRLMRRALADLWPPRLRRRRSKSLFTVPIVDALRPLAVALLNGQPWEVVERGWVDRKSLVSRLDKLIRGLDCNQSQLQQIVALECWLQQQRSGLRTAALEAS
jgi:asparagine synthase (glutamine-hydrolysing)